MARIEITMKIKFAWWLKPYLYALAVIHAVRGTEPEWEKITRVCERAMRVRVE